MAPLAHRLFLLHYSTQAAAPKLQELEGTHVNIAGGEERILEKAMRDLRGQESCCGRGRRVKTGRPECVVEIGLVERSHEKGLSVRKGS